MSTLPESIGQLARAFSQLFRLPTAAVLVLASLGSGVALLLAIVNVTSADPAGAGHWIGLGLAILVALPVALFAALRWRWFHRVEQQGSEVVSTEVLAPADLASRVSSQMGDTPGAQDAQILMDAIAEGRMPAGAGSGKSARLTRWLGSGRLGVLGYALTRVEQVQRALLVAAGGRSAAPYLKDDLRLSTLSFIGSLLAIPLGGLLAIILALVLLTA